MALALSFGCVRAVPLSDLLARGPVTETETLFVRAAFRVAYPCEPCPDGAQCQPCKPVVVIAESAEASDEEAVWLLGSAEGLKTGHTYTFELSLRPGYEPRLRSRSFFDPLPLLLSVR